MFYLMMHSTHFFYDFKRKNKELFHLMTHSTHFIYSFMVSGILKKDHSHSERGNPLLPLRLAATDLLYIYHPTDRLAHTISLCYVSRGARWITGNTSLFFLAFTDFFTLEPKHSLKQTKQRSATLNIFVM